METTSILETLEESEFDALKRKLLSLSMRYQKTLSDAEDVVSETLLQILRKEESFEGKSSFSTWAYRVCVNKNLEALRKKKTIAQHLKGVFSDFLSGVRHQEHEFLPLKEDFRQALDSLDDKERSVFILTVYEEMPQKQIAEVLSMSVSNVKVTLHRGRKKLMSLLREYVEV